MIEGKKILVTGGTGMIGRALVGLLRQHNEIDTVSIDKTGIDGINHIVADLTYRDVCEDLCASHEVVFHLAGVKGSPTASMTKPASFFVPMLQFNTNMMRAALEKKCEHFLYTSSVGVYNPKASVFKEEDVKYSFPSDNDWYAGWAKRIGEMQAEAYEIQYGWNDYSVIRPANVYGPYDNFDIENCMVIPALIYKMIERRNEPLVLQGDGSNIRDFVYSEDVARAMIFMVEKKLKGPYNIGSGESVSIADLVEKLGEIIGFNQVIQWMGGASGDKQRLMDMSKLYSHGYKNKTSLLRGLISTVAWYQKHRDIIHNRTNYFK